MACVEVEAEQNNALPFGWCDVCMNVWVGGRFGSPAQICVTICMIVRASGTSP
jgi:hypothetical protein